MPCRPLRVRMLEPAGKRGYAVRHFTIDDSYRVTEIRRVLEGYAARELAARQDRGPIVASLRRFQGIGFSPKATSSRRTRRRRGDEPAISSSHHERCS